MSYVLGIDLGTTFSAAAVDVEGRSEIFQLGSRAAVIPSVVVLRADGETLTGEAAERRAQSEPTRTAREFKRRLGDPTPLILGGTPYGAESVLSVLLKAMVEQVTAQRGEPPALTCVTHPASYGPYKLDLLQQAVRQADIGEAMFLSEPQAAALHYASQERIEPGTVVAVYDFGGGTFDAAVLRKTEDSFEMLGEPGGMERLGGIDFDEAIFQHVVRSLEGSIEDLDHRNPAATAGVARLREECQRAKEALSADTEAVIPVLLPNVQTEVRLTRAEFEGIIAPRIRETVAVLERSVRSAGLTMDQVDRILLVGGTSRIPLVSAAVREQTGKSVAVDTHPKHAIALGAAAEARRRFGEETTAGAPAVAPEEAVPVAAPLPPVLAPEPDTAPVTATAPPPVEELPAPLPAPAALATPTVQDRPVPAASTQGPPPPGRTAPPWWMFAGGAAVLGAAAIGAFMLFAGGDDDDPAELDSTATPTEAATAATTVAGVATAQATPTPTATLAPNTSRITGIAESGGRYEVDFEVAGFTPSTAAQHVHFFFDTVPPQQAGLPADGPWFVYGGSSPFTGYGPSDRPAGAERMCILVANADHSVIQNTGNCVDLP